MTSPSDITACALRAERIQAATGGGRGNMRITHVGTKPPWVASLLEFNSAGDSPEQAAAGVLAQIEAVAKRQLIAAKDDASKLEEALR